MVRESFRSSQSSQTHQCPTLPTMRGKKRLCEQKGCVSVTDCMCLLITTGSCSKHLLDNHAQHKFELTRAPVLSGYTSGLHRAHCLCTHTTSPSAAGTGAGAAAAGPAAAPCRPAALSAAAAAASSASGPACCPATCCTPAPAVVRVREQELTLG